MPPATTAPDAAPLPGWNPTYGWAPLDYPAVNAAIAAAKSSPDSFAYTHNHTIPNPAETFGMRGTFGNWQLLSGGNQFLRLSVPIPTSTLSVVDWDYSVDPDDGTSVGNSTTTNTDYGLIEATIELNVLWQNPDGTTLLSATTTGPLATNDDGDSGGDSGGDGDSPPAVSIVSLDYGTNTLDDNRQTIYQSLFLEWLSANLPVFAQVMRPQSIGQR